MHPDIPQPAFKQKQNEGTNLIEEGKGEKKNCKKGRKNRIEYKWMTSSPIKKTLGSADISSSSAVLRASRTVICSERRESEKRRVWLIFDKRLDNTNLLGGRRKMSDSGEGWANALSLQKKMCVLFCSSNEVE